MKISALPATTRRTMTTAQLRAEGICTNCRRYLAEEGLGYCSRCRERNRVAKKRWNVKERENNPGLVRERARIDRVRLKIQVFYAYGGPICVCCGEDVFDLLTIDHVNNDGATQRKKLGHGINCRSKTFYQWLRRNNFPSGYRILCFNCNTGRSLNGGVCPHETRQIDEERRKTVLSLPYTPHY